MITFLPESQENLLAARFSGTLTRDDYGQFRDRAEQLMRQYGKVRCLLELDDIQGCEPGAAWDDLKFGLSHLGRFEGCAVVGDRRWEEWMIKLSKPFFPVEYFDRSQRDAALDWVRHPERAVRHGLVGEVWDFARRHPLASAAVGLGVGALVVWSLRPRTPAGALSA
jgi:hypothetical protein